MPELLRDAPIEVRYESDNPYERYKYSHRYSDEIVKLSQVRREKNLISRQLFDDVRLNGLINPIDVAVVPEDLLAEYLGFVEKTWGEAASIEEFEELQDEGGNFTLLVAGHSRHQVIEDIEDQCCIETGTMVRHPIPVKEHPVASVWDIIRIQLGENIHSQPPKERQAIALVEAYEYGLGENRWGSVDEFLATEEATANTSRSFMAQALKFRQLPAEIRSYVLSGPVHYYAGIELAQTVGPIRSYYLEKFGLSGKDIDENNEAQIKELVTQQLAIIANRTVEKRMNSTAAKSYIKSQRKHFATLKEAMTSQNGAGGNGYGTLDLEFITDDPMQREKDFIQEEIAKQLRSMARIQGDDVTNLIMLARGMVGDEVVRDCLDKQREQAEKTVKRVVSAIGPKAVGAA